MGADEQKAPSKLAIQSARTRARLIAATLELLPVHGLQKLTVDAVAARAGMTKGAVYASFPNKEALIMAALATRPQGRPDHVEWPTDRSGTVRERLRKLGEAIIAAPGGGGSATARAEFLLYAVTHDTMRDFVGAVGVQSRRQMEDNILALFTAAELPMSVPAFALLLSNLIPALIYSRAFAGDRLDDALVLDVFEGLSER